MVAQKQTCGTKFDGIDKEIQNLQYLQITRSQVFNLVSKWFCFLVVPKVTAL